MLHTISWRTYFTGIACILTVYYVVVVYLYYRDDLLKQIKRLLSGQSLSTQSYSTSFTASTDPALLVADFSDELTGADLNALIWIELAKCILMFWVKLGKTGKEKLRQMRLRGQRLAATYIRVIKKVQVYLIKFLLSFYRSSRRKVARSFQTQ